MNVILASTVNNGIGLKGTIPWHIPADLKYFKSLTINKIVVMGYNTWVSINSKPLPNRINVILTRKTGLVNTEDVYFFNDYETIINHFIARLDDIFFIGGSSIYNWALKDPRVKNVYHTLITYHFTCDTFYDGIDTRQFQLVSSEPITDDYQTSVVALKMVYKRNEPEYSEEEYLRVVKSIISNGILKTNRTAVQTISQFGLTMKFNLEDDSFPLLTTKKVFVKGIIEELLFFIRGSTNSNELSEKGIKIWEQNTTREFLDQRGLKRYKVGDMGPLYGFQWRFSGAEYEGYDKDYTGQGIDQLIKLINDIKNDPGSRRLLMCTWIPKDLDKMVLCPCHVLFQVYIRSSSSSSKLYLDSMMYQRSADVALGVPFNIASYALLSKIIAHCCGLEAGIYTHVMGDAHIYVNHVEPLKTQLTRSPRPWPKLKILTDNRNITQFKYEDFSITDYNPHPAIKMDMVA